jgi:hydrogenase maturation protease
MIVVDAVQLGGNVGDLHILAMDDIPAAESQAVSLHGIGLQETLSIAEVLYPEQIPKQIVLIGIEGSHFNELGVPLSQAVEAAVELVVLEIKRRIKSLVLIEF